MGRFLIVSFLWLASYAQAELKIHDAKVRAMPPGQPNTAAFMLLTNTGKQDITLVAASTMAAKKAEYHNHVKNAAGVMSMQQVPSIKIAAGASFEFKTGSFHIMLLGLKKPLKPGESVPLTLKDVQGTHYTYDIPVVSLMEQSDMHHHHHHGKE